MGTLSNRYFRAGFSYHRECSLDRSRSSSLDLDGVLHSPGSDLAPLRYSSLSSHNGFGTYSIFPSLLVFLTDNFELSSSDSGSSYARFGNHSAYGLTGSLRVRASGMPSRMVFRARRGSTSPSFLVVAIHGNGLGKSISLASMITVANISQWRFKGCGGEEQPMLVIRGVPA